MTVPISQAARSDALQGVYKPLSNYVGEVSANSYSGLKRTIGTAKESIGNGFEWHHIIEQKSAAQLGQQAVQNTKNVVGIPVQAHRQISALYSTKLPQYGGQVMRQVVSQLPRMEQFQVGLKALSDVLSKLK